jgi:ferredoxin
MQGAVAAVIADPVPEGVEASCQEASNECPVSAISLQEEGSGS